jgi:hypothetical protein
MQFFTVGDSWELRHVLAAFDWTSLDKPGTTVVDIGGGFGNGQPIRRSPDVIYTFCSARLAPRSVYGAYEAT